MQRATQGDIPAWQKSCSEADLTRTERYFVRPASPGVPSLRASEYYDAAEDAVLKSVIS